MPRKPSDQSERQPILSSLFVACLVTLAGCHRGAGSLTAELEKASKAMASNPSQAAAAAAPLVEQATKDPKPFVLALESSENPKVRYAAAYVLGQTPRHESAAALIKSSKDRQMGVASVSVQGMAKLLQSKGLPDADRRVILARANEILMKGGENIQYPAIECVEILQDPTSVPGLEKCILRYGFSSRSGKKAAQVLAAMGNDRAIPALLDAVSKAKAEQANLEQFVESAQSRKKKH